MKYLFLISFIFLLNCSPSYKAYMCGDKPCANKKEFKEYFAENLTIEVQTAKDKKNTSVDLVKLNTTNEADLKKEQDEALKKQIIEREKIEAAKIKIEEEKKRIKEEKRLKETEKKEVARIEPNKTQQKEKIVEKIINEKTNDENSNKNTKEDNICKIIEECDIDKIAEILIKQGREKDYPDITSN